ncbi:MAG: hypothetical protein IJU41_02170, partial [Clostridia bacterium]|nr:hypothetical protein [Clostridia bacterium]
MQKRILCLALALCMLFTMIPMTASAAGEVEISTADQLLEIMNDSSKWATSYVLTADIDLSTATSELSQAPIGRSGSNLFSGTFDGDGHTISGINIDTGSAGYAGLFGYASGTIKNLTLYGSVSSTGQYTGALVGVAVSPCRVLNVENHATVAGGSTSVGGIVGAFVPNAGLTGEISGVTNYGTITGTKYIGGVLGYLQTKTGTGASFSISDAVNCGQVTASGACAGGIIGYIIHTNANANTFTVDSCENRGAVQGTTYAGGIVGAYGDASKGSATPFAFTALSNRGTITATTGVAAGIVGMSKPNAANIASYSDCVNYGTISAPYGAAGFISVTSTLAFSMSNIYNGGAYTGTTTNNTYPSLPVLSKTTSVTLSGVYYGGSENASETHGTFVADPTNAAVFESFDFTETWAMGQAGPEIRAFHTHNTGAPVSVSNDDHRLDCTCGYAGAFEAHDFVDGVCTVCGFEQTDCEHANTHDVITTAPTCVATGLKNVVCDDCGNTVATDVAVAVDPDNHVGALLLGFDKNGSGEIDYYCDACDAVLYEDYSYTTDVYVSTLGFGFDMDDVPTEALGTETLPFASFYDAMTYAAYAAEQNDDDVTVHIQDRADITGRYQTPASEHTITVTGGTLNFAAASTHIYMNSPMTFEDLTITANDGAADLTGGMVLAAKGHKLVLGEGIVMGNSGTTSVSASTTPINTVKLYVLGGYQNTPAVTTLATDVTVRSGEYWLVDGWNRQNSSSTAVHGTAKLTIGKTNADDTLKMAYLLPFSTNNNCYISETSKSTVIIDGEVTVDYLYAFGNTNATATDGIGYQVDFVLKGDIQNTAGTGTNGVYFYADHSSFASAERTLNVYTDTRVATAVMDSAAFVGEEKSATLPETVGNYTYFDYCVTYLGGHTYGGDGFCTKCGFDSNCAHTHTHEVITAAATCVSTGTRTLICDDCGDTISTAEIPIDADNHADTAFVWNYDSATEKYYMTCSACSAAYSVQDETPVVYVHGVNGDDAQDGLTAETAVRTLSAAVAHLANCGGTVVITSYTLSANETLPSWNGRITFTAGSFDKNGAATTGITIGKQNVVLTMGGDAKFDAILLRGASSTNYRLYLAANWHNLDVGYLRIQNYATTFVFAGPASITGADTAAKTVALNLDMPAMSTGAGEYFYERIYLGGAIASPSADIENKNVLLTVNDGYINSKASTRTQGGTINTVYAISTTNVEARNAAVVSGCTSSITLNGSVVLNNLRTGDAGAALYPAAVSLDNLTLV